MLIHMHNIGYLFTAEIRANENADFDVVVKTLKIWSCIQSVDEYQI